MSYGTKPMHTPPRQELTKDTKNTIWSILVQWSHNYKTKQNKLPSFIDRYIQEFKRQCQNLCNLDGSEVTESKVHNNVSKIISALLQCQYLIQAQTTPPKEWLFVHTLGSYVRNCECLCMYGKGLMIVFWLFMVMVPRIELIRWYLVSSL